jgi:iron complex outermembrane receptor protein
MAMKKTEIVVSALTVLLAGSLHGQQAEAPGSPLDDLLRTPISTAAKYDQPMSSVAASVTVITAEEIARNGWHTLADALASTRGVYTTYDRNYTYVGIRGYGLPSDYNNRFLVLLDGQPLLDNISGAGEIGTALAIDLSTFARIEFVRGPGSVLYGTGAMFGVINLITKDEGERSSATVGAGNDGLRMGTARGAMTRGSVKGSIAVSWQDKAGGDLYFPEFDSPNTNDGIVRGHDYDRYRSVLATLAWKDLRIHALNSTRRKGVPTASWETLFGADEKTADIRSLVALDYNRSIGTGQALSLRAFQDRFTYDGTYPYSIPSETDHSTSTRDGAELRYTWDIRPAHRLTLGSEYVYNRVASYKWTGGHEVGSPFTEASVYAQGESRLSSRLTITAGARYDHHSNSGSRFTPRGAAILQIGEGSVLKALYGQAFRAPNVYELLYDGPGFVRADGLRAEDIRTSELIWEKRIGRDLLLTASLFDTSVKALVRLQSLDENVQFQNGGRVGSRGGELQLDYRRDDGIWGYISYSGQRTTEDEQPVNNSPRNMLKGGLSSSTARKAFGSVEMQYESSRRTNGGNTTADVLLTNLSFGASLTRNVSISATIRNAFDVAYATPVGIEHRQDTILQDGRSFLIRLKVVGR